MTERLHERIAALRGALTFDLLRSGIARMDMPFTGSLVYPYDMPRMLRAVRLALHLIRSLICLVGLAVKKEGSVNLRNAAGWLRRKSVWSSDAE